MIRSNLWQSLKKSVGGVRRAVFELQAPKDVIKDVFSK